MRVAAVILTVAAMAAAATAQSVGHTARGAWDIALTGSGVFGRDTAGAGGTWPRGTAFTRSYLWNGGVWFGCSRNADTAKRLVEVTFAPYLTPAFAPLMVNGQPEPLYSSLEYNADGTPKSAGAPLWPIRNVRGTPILKNDNSGEYVKDKAQRPAHEAVFLSDHDLVAVFGDSANRTPAYPIGLEGTISLYSWDVDSLRDVVVGKITLKNVSTDTLVACYMAPMAVFAVGDTDNDMGEKLYGDTILALDVYSDVEAAGPLGRAGFAVLNPPRGVKFRDIDLWDNFRDPRYDADRYTHLSQPSSMSVLYSTVRGLASCGPFTLAPGQHADLAFAIAGGLDSANATSRDTNLLRLTSHLRAARNYWLGFNTPSSVGHAELPTDDGATLAPQPIGAEGTITFKSPLPKGVRFTLVDTGGRTVNAAIRRVDDRRVHIDAGSLPPGMYILRVTSATGTRVQRVQVAR